MSDQLVHDVGLRCVERHRVVAHVLRREEAALGERAVERAGRYQSRHGFEAEAGEPLEAARHLGELWHPVRRQGEPVGCCEVLGARVLVVLLAKLPRHHGPQRVLFVGVLHDRDRPPGLVRLADPCDRGAAGPVRRIGDPGVVGGQGEVGTGLDAHGRTLPRTAAVRTGSSR